MIKNKFVKNRVGGRGVNLHLENIFKYTGFYLEVTPQHYCCFEAHSTITKLALFQENIACRPKSFKKVVIMVGDQELADGLEI